MSINGWLLAVTPGQTARLRAQPRLSGSLVRAVESDRHRAIMQAIEQRMTAEQRALLEAQRSADPALAETMRTHTAAAERAREAIAPLGSIAEPLELAKSWHLLHYLLTAHTDPAAGPGNLLLAGDPIGDDVGYGPARLHAPPAVREFADFLATQTAERLADRISPRDLEARDVYGVPRGASADHAFERGLRDEVATHFPRLAGYARSAAATGNVLLVWLS